MLTAVLLYLSILVLVGGLRSRRVKTGDDFLVAGRTLPARVLVFTLLATWVGSGSLFAGAGLGYRAGFPALWQSAGAWVGIALIYFIAPRVRRIAQYTVPDILELRYGATARVLGTITTVLAYGTIAAYQFRGGGRLLNVLTDGGVDPATGRIDGEHNRRRSRGGSLFHAPLDKGRQAELDHTRDGHAEHGASVLGRRRQGERS